MHKLKGRPKKARTVRLEPKIQQFSPRGMPGRPGYIVITCDEMEALRLSDFSGIDQKEAAISMNISQQTYSRILRKARKGLAEALVLGKIIRIKGGIYKFK